MREKTNTDTGLRTKAEIEEAMTNKDCFNRNPAVFEKKMENFPKYVRRQNMTRFLSLYEIFKRIINIKGSIIECGVNEGFGILAWSKLSAILEPSNLTRRIYGFDTFEGFPNINEKDRSPTSTNINVGDMFADSYDEINELSRAHDSTRFLGHIPKVDLIKGDPAETIPAFLEENPHILVSLLFLDFDLYEPTRTALECFLPRMCKGAVVAFDELDNPLWPGETQALLDVMNAADSRIERLYFDPYIGMITI